MKKIKQILEWISLKKKELRKYQPSTMGITIGTLTELEEWILK
jgi:hypothetical protein